MRLCLVEDLAVAGLEPLTLTRPVYELWLGCSNLGTKIATAFGIGEGPQQRGGVVRSHLVPVQHQRNPHVVVNDRDWLARGSVIVANGRWVPPGSFEPPDSHGPWLGLCGGQPACTLVGPEDAVGTRPSFHRFLVRQDRRQAFWFRCGRRVDKQAVGPGGPKWRLHRARFLGRTAERSDQPSTGDPCPGGAVQPAEPARDSANRPLHRFRHDEWPHRGRTQRLGPAVHPGAGPMLHRVPDPTLSGEHPGFGIDRPELPDWRRG